MSNTPITITPTRIQIKHDTAANWETVNPVLAAGEQGYDTTNHQTRIGDGVTHWKDLPYFATKKPIKTVSFATDSEETVTEALAAYYNGEVSLQELAYKVGDERNITLSTNETLTFVLGGREHDVLSGGTGKAAFTLFCKNLMATKYTMNSSSTNSGGWESSQMRSTTLQTIFSRLPQAWQNLIKTVNKKTSAGSQSTSITTTSDKLWLLSAAEIYSQSALDSTTNSDMQTNKATYKAEGEQYEYFKNLIGNADPALSNSLLIKKLSNGTGSANWWWLRSLGMGNTATFRSVYSDGDIGNGYANSANGVCFGFCI